MLGRENVDNNDPVLSRYKENEVVKPIKIKPSGAVEIICILLILVYPFYVGNGIRIYRLFSCLSNVAIGSIEEYLTINKERLSR